MAPPFGSPIAFNTPYGANLSYDFKAEGDGTYGMSPIFNASDNYWSGNSIFDQPTNYNQWANPFGSAASGASKALGSMGGMSPGAAALGGFNMAQTYAGMAAINAAEEANRRKIDTAYYKLGDEWSRFTNARNYLGEGTHLDQAAGNLSNRRFFNDLNLNHYSQAKQIASDKWNNPTSLAGKIGFRFGPYG